MKECYDVCSDIRFREIEAYVREKIEAAMLYRNQPGTAYQAKLGALVLG